MDKKTDEADERKPAEDAAPDAASPSPKPPPVRRRAFSIPTGGGDHPWWVRHALILSIFEWFMALLLIGTALYYLWFLVFPAGREYSSGDPLPTIEDFRIRVRELPAVPPEGEWVVADLSPRWRRIVLHHSATASGSAESFDRVHREERKWENGLGYHFVIGNGKGMGDGEIAVGRRWLEQLDGAHIRGTRDGGNLNAESIGIALVGNFETGLPTARQLAALKGLVTFLRQRCSISLADIVGHRDVSGRSTLCPGAHFYIDELRLALANP